MRGIAAIPNSKPLTLLTMEAVPKLKFWNSDLRFNEPLCPIADRNVFQGDTPGVVRIRQFITL
jgi:hypothetical protein